MLHEIITSIEAKSLLDIATITEETRQEVFEKNKNRLSFGARQYGCHFKTWLNQKNLQL